MARASGALAGLEREAVEHHLTRCSGCRELAGMLDESLGAARSWSPEMSGQEITRAIDRLSPYLPPARGRRTMVVGAALVMAGLAALAVTATHRQVDVPAEAHTSFDLGPDVRMMTSPDWLGTLSSPTPRDSRIEMTRGFVVVEFDRSRGRHLVVHAASLEVEAIGTRFFVEVGPRGQIFVGVHHGRVRVTSPFGADILGAGDRATYDPDGSRGAPAGPIRALAHLEEVASVSSATIALGVAEAVAALAPPAGPPPSARAPRETAPTPAKAVAPTHVEVNRSRVDPVRDLAAGEAFVQAGQPEAAYALYRGLAESRGLGAIHRSIARFEMARLDAFSLGRPERARAALEELAGGEHAEVRRQAKLTLCELTLAADRCAAYRCLESARGTEGAAVASDTERLISRWGLVPGDCAHKGEGVSQPR